MQKHHQIMQKRAVTLKEFSVVVLFFIHSTFLGRLLLSGGLGVVSPPTQREALGVKLAPWWSEDQQGELSHSFSSGGSRVEGLQWPMP